MTTADGAAPAQPSAVTGPLLSPVAWLGAAVAAGALSAAGAAPFATLAVLLVVASAVGVLHSPFVFLWITAAISGIGLGWTGSAAILLGGNLINVNGLRWALVLITSVVILVRLGGAGVPRALRGWLAFVALAAVGMLWAPNRFEALKQFLLYAAPLVTAVVALRAIRHPADVVRLRTALYVAAGIAALAGLIPALAGDVLGGPLDPDGRILHRAFGTFLLPVMAVSLARFRYGDMRQGAIALALFGLTLLTLSRVSAGAMVVLVLLAMGGTSLRLRAALAAVLVAFVITASLYDPLRERFFADRRGFTARVEITGTGQAAQLDLGGLQLSGRGLVWLQTWSNAVRAPVIGHGTGSATVHLAERTGGGAIFPHNEYLRVFHDFGAVGLGCLLAAFGMVLVTFRRIRRYAVSRTSRELALAALLCWVAFALVSLFDNPLGYFTFFTHNLFMVTALALRSAELDVV